MMDDVFVWATHRHTSNWTRYVAEWNGLRCVVECVMVEGKNKFMWEVMGDAPSLAQALKQVDEMTRQIKNAA